MTGRLTSATLALGLVLPIGLQGCAYPSEDGWRDPITGNLTCRQAPAAVRSWSTSGRVRTPGDHADLQTWVGNHSGALNTRYGAQCATPLHLAAQFDREDVVAILLAHGASPGVHDEAGNTPLNIAASYAHTAVIKVLVSGGADVNLRGRNGSAPLTAAVTGLGVNTDLTRRLEAVRLLIDAGADVNAREAGNGFTPLFYAAGPSTTYSDEIVHLLLARGADPRAFDAHGTPVLVGAAGGGHRAAVQMLLDRGADVNGAGRDEGALAAAAHGGHLDVVSLLLERGGKVDHRIAGSRAEWNGLPLAAALVVVRDADKATMTARRDVARLLVDHGADVDARTETGETLLHRAAFEGDVAAVDMLLTHGAVAAPRDRAGITPLHRAVQAGRVEVAARLLARGADSAIAAADGTTALSLARGDPQMEALIRRHAKN